MRVAAALLALVWLAAAAASPARAAPLAVDASNGPIAAHGDDVAWSRWDDAAGAYRLLASHDGVTRTLSVAPSALPFSVVAGAGPDGATWLVWSRCVRLDCDLEAYDLGTGTPQPLPAAAKPGVSETAPAIWHNRLVFVTGAIGPRPQVHLAAVAGGSDRVLAAIGPSFCIPSPFGECTPLRRASVQSTALDGNRLAIATRIDTKATTSGICGLANVRLIDLPTGVERTLDTATCGLNGQGFGDLSFDAAGRLWWRMTCNDGCLGTGAAPLRLAPAGGVQRLATTLGSRITAFAVAGSTPLLETRAAFTATGCRTTQYPDSGYRCGTIAAAAARFAHVTPEHALPPPGYLTVRASGPLNVLRPPSRIACSRGNLEQYVGALLWAGVSWRAGRGRGPGPAVPVTATSGARTARGIVPRVPLHRSEQATTRLHLGSRAQSCGRTWRLTYRPPGRRAIRFTTRVANP